MKFRVRIKELKVAMEPILAVATTNGIKDYESSGNVTFIAEKDQIVSIVDNGHMQLMANVNETAFPNLEYEFIEGGSVNVRAKELSEVIGSFGDGDTIEVEIISSGESDNDDEGKEVRFSDSSDLEIYQTLSTVRDSIGFPKMIMDKIETVDPFVIRRDLYAMASKRLIFANGYEDFRPEYKYWIIRAKKDELRFAAGTGGRFAVIDYEGKDFTNAKEDKNVLIPGEQSALLLKVIPKIHDETINMFILDDHLVVRTEDYIMSMPQYDPDVNWPDEEKFLSRNNSYRMSTRLGDWPSIVKGILATCNDEFRKSNDYHLAIMTANTDKNEILVEAKGRTMKSKRKARISDIEGKMPNNLKIRIESNYIAEAFKSAAADDYAQWEFDPDSSSIVVLRFYASPEVGDPKEFSRVNTATGIKERYSIFFGTHGENF